MNPKTPASEQRDRSISRAAERYLEQYGEPSVLNRYLTAGLLALGLVSVALVVALVEEHWKDASQRPVVIRINEIGQAQALDYNDFKYRPQEVENRHYLAQWAQLYYGRNRFSIQKDFTSSLYFL